MVPPSIVRSIKERILRQRQQSIRLESNVRNKLESDPNFIHYIKKFYPDYEDFSYEFVNKIIKNYNDDLTRIKNFYNSMGTKIKNIQHILEKEYEPVHIAFLTREIFNTIDKVKEYETTFEGKYFLKLKNFSKLSSTFFINVALR